MVRGSNLVNPDRQIDCTGLFCPMPIVMTREAIAQMGVGELLEMRSDDPASEADMRSWARNTGHDLLEITRRGIVYRFVIRRTRSRGRPRGAGPGAAAGARGAAPPPTPGADGDRGPPLSEGGVH